ncbi:hypothetical protein POM88_031215 [Heracleum sosnowskyi]|uniref:Uncharacterized protein n=1 Tax=Heracleum sosnowskyi TaxID=360622 RepID=A0AAD8HWZ3_9APIA|nr:hypothetical protein POM88_031215 [Heracleum sosnowskyi]
MGTILDLPQDNLSQITEFQILGSVTCPITSTLPLSGILGVAAVPVTATCLGVNNIVDYTNGLTNAFGRFSLPITGLNNGPLSLDPDQQISCTVTISFPVSGTSCQTFPSSGSLLAPAQFSSTIVNNVLGGLIAVLNLGPFQYVA